LPAAVYVFLLLILFAFGLLLGSFLNVCIYRLPRGKSLLSPRRSYCPICHETIRWYDNIPLFSYLYLGGLCRHCASRIAARYFFVELLTACVIVLCFHVLQARDESAGVIVVYAATTCVLIVATFIDIDLRIIPDEITIGGMFAALLLCAIFPGVHDKPEHGRALLLMPLLKHRSLGALAAALAGMLLGSFLIYASGVLGKFVFRREAMGLGDVKYMAFLGAVLGWKQVLFTFLLAPVLGVVVGLVQLLRSGEHRLPYAPYLSLAAVTVMLAGRNILAFLGLETLLVPFRW